MRYAYSVVFTALFQSSLLFARMKVVIAVAVLLTCLMSFNMAEPNYSGECLHACTQDYNPICGMQVKVEKKEFPNSCTMERENKCNGGDYVPCQDVRTK